MSALVLDAGALVALEHNDRPLWAALKAAAVDGIAVIVPAAALAQTWRGGPRSARLAQALTHCAIAALDETAAKAVGLLCARTATIDIADASVALCAAHHGGTLYTSDFDDLDRLLDQLGRYQTLPPITLAHC